MPNVTSIEWTAWQDERGAWQPGYTSNPLRARDRETGRNGTFCVHSSPGCANCYAGRLNRWRGNGLDFVAQNAGKVEFFLNERELTACRKLPAGSRVFICDMCDLFYEGVPEELIHRIFGAMALAPDVTFQVLTKRADRMRRWLQIQGVNRTWRPFPLPNVWVGVSVEDKQRRERLDQLAQTPAALRFVSFEPLLEDLGDLSPWLYGPEVPCPCGVRGCEVLHRGPRAFDWVIAGGESGPGARPCDLAWIRSLVAQCQAAGVPAFVKQLGARPYFVDEEGADVPEEARGGSDIDGVENACTAGLYTPSAKGGDPAYWPSDLRVRQFPEAPAS